MKTSRLVSRSRSRLESTPSFGVRVVVQAERSHERNKLLELPQVIREIFLFAASLKLFMRVSQSFWVNTFSLMALMDPRKSSAPSS